MRRYNKIVTQIAHQTLDHWKKNLITDGVVTFNNGYSETISKNRDPIDFIYTANLHLSLDDSEVYIIDGGIDPGDLDEGEEAVMFVDIWASTNSFPNIWSEIAIDLRDIIRHELEHLTQSGPNKLEGKEFDDDSALRELIASELLPRSAYFMLPAEVDAMLQGLWFKTKKSRQPWRNVVNSYLSTLELSSQDYQAILNLWNKRTKALSLPSLT